MARLHRMTPLRTKQAIAALGSGVTYVNASGNGISGYFQFNTESGSWEVYVNAWYTCTNGTLVVMDTSNI